MGKKELISKYRWQSPFCLIKSNPMVRTFLTLNVPCISESCIGIRAFIKPFEAPQRNVKIKI